MKISSGWTVKAQLIFGFGGIVTLIVILASFSVSRMYEIDTLVKSQNKLRTEKLERLYVAREALDQTGLAARNAFVFENDVDADKELDILDQQKAIYLEQLNAMAPLFVGDPDFEKAKDGLLLMAEELKRPRQYRLSGKLRDYGEFLVKECSPLRRQIVSDIDVLLKSVQRTVDTQSQLAESAISESVSIILLASLIALCISVGMGVFITREILRQLGGEPKDVASIAHRVASGDLAFDVVTRNGDNTSTMYEMQAMKNNLFKIVAQVHTGTNTIVHASEAIASGNHQLSSLTEQQTASLADTALSIEKLALTVRQNADNARQGNELVMVASDVAVRGGEVMSQVVGTMESINQSALEIVDIIDVMDGIAFQTNILALNAAVEAARAGEQGRGFAVVATEVRNLAQRSTTAAKEITLLINDSVDQINAGTKLVRDAGATMQEIVDSVTRVTKIMAEILAASHGQMMGIEQVNHAIVKMDKVTHENAALAEQAKVAAASLQEEAAFLTNAVSIFRLNEAYAGTNNEIYKISLTR